jgi:hypothetical protein
MKQHNTKKQPKRWKTARNAWQRLATVAFGVVVQGSRLSDIVILSSFLCASLSSHLISCWLLVVVVVVVVVVSVVIVVSVGWWLIQ